MEPSTADSARINWLWTFTFLIGPVIVPFFLYRHFTDPLRSIPGPFLARLTGIWVVLLDLSGNRGTTIHKLHQKYGHVVRIAPNQLCFASPQALKDIYGANSKYPKAPIYDSLGFKSVFTTRNRDEYRVMKKRIVPSFSQAAVSGMESSIHRQVANLIKCFDKRVDVPLDVLPWFRMLALSVVGEGFAAESFGGLETEKTPELLHKIDSVFPTLWVWWMFPLSSKIAQYSPIKPIRQFLGAANEFRKYCRATYEKFLASRDSSEHDTLIARMVNEQSALMEKNESIPRHLTEQGIVDELTNLIFAGTDTTGNTLTYLFWELSHHPEWQQRLREEVNAVVGYQENPTYDAIAELPVLEAVVQEILRLRPAALGGLQRLVPESGGVVDGFAVPPHIIVSCQALSAQREPTIFPEPDSFNPQRWIDAEKAGNVELLRDQMIVFGKGARACLGRRLAMMELKCAIAAIAIRYTVSIGSPTTDDDMEMTDHIVLIPKGQKCVLRLTRV